MISQGPIPIAGALVLGTGLVALSHLGGVPPTGHAMPHGVGISPRLAAPSVASPPGIRPGLYALSFASDRAGCAGGLHRIVCTTDAGRRWTPRYAGAETVVGLDLLTPRVGWAVGVHTLLKTVDGGLHWAQAGVGEPTQPLRSVDFVTAARGWGVAGGTPLSYAGTHQVSWPFAGGTLVQTLDGGRTWAIRPTAGPVDSICFNGGAGWAAHEATVLRTQDGGRTWRRAMTFPITHSRGWFASVRCTGAATAWVLLSGGVGASNQQPYLLYRTSDGGRHWQAVLKEVYFAGSAYPSLPIVVSGPGSYIGPLSAVDRATAYVLGICFPCSLHNSIVMSRVQNGGQTVHYVGAVPGLTSEGPLAIAFVDASHGWVAGTTGHVTEILATSNGGKTWQRQF